MERTGEWEKELVGMARTAAKGAYCPYSHYPVGAAVLAEGGTVFTGCNVENASYGLCNCAERTAIFKAVSEGHRSFSAIAIAGGTKSPAFPCGACRQVIAEFCRPETVVLVATLRGRKITRTTLRELLPFGFTL